MQLTLPVHLPLQQSFDSFIEGQNAQLVARLHALVSQEKQPHGERESVMRYENVFIHGTQGQGKSHLLYAICHYADAINVSHFYLNCNQASVLPIDVLEGLSDTYLLCIDDVHLLDLSEAWQLALFDLINQRIERQSGLVVFTSIFAPHSFHSHRRWLPDLTSRFEWGEVYGIRPLADDDKIALMQYHAAQRGLKVSMQTFQFIINHYERSNSELVNVIERLDKRSLIEKKPISINMIKRELDL